MRDRTILKVHKTEKLIYLDFLDLTTIFAQPKPAELISLYTIYCAAQSIRNYPHDDKTIGDLLDWSLTKLHSVQKRLLALGLLTKDEQ